MKTLDELIKTMDHVEFCCTNCKLQFDCDEVECILGDALHYLKEYHDAYGNVIASMNHHLRKIHELEQNGPLTWNELRTMERKPVWATFDNENGTWYIAKVYDDEVVLYEWGQEFGERISGAWDYTPKRWQAYRKERG